MAKFRRMRRNESTAIPTQLVTVAVDWQDMRLGSDGAVVRRMFSRAVACGCRIREGRATAQTVASFSSPEYFWDWLDQETDPKRLTWVVMVGAGAALQLLGLGRMLDSRRWSIDTPGGKRTATSVTIGQDGLIGGMFVVNDPPVIVGLIGPRRGRVLVLSTENYIDSDIDEISTMAGLERMPPGSSSQGGVTQAAALRRDAEIVQKWMMDLIGWWIENDFGMLRWTVGGLSMAAYRHRFMTTPPVLHDDEDARRLERAAYRGGESNCFFIGKVEQAVHQIDVTSLFPHVMRCGHFPQRLVNYVELSQWRSGPPPGNPEEMIAEVAVVSPRKPILVAGDDGVIRCTGKIITALVGPELAAAVAEGLVVGWRSVAVYHLEPLFRSFVDEIWPIRKAYLESGEVGKARLTKRLLNCLYGKWGQYGRRLIYRPDMVSPRPWAPFWVLDSKTRRQRYFFSVGDKVFEETVDDSHGYSSAAISGFITAYARQYMDSMREIAGPDQVFYQAIDSLVVSDLGLARLEAANMIAENELGKFRLEHSAENVTIGGVHDYQIGGKVVTGWKSSVAVKVAESSWQQIQAERLGQSIRHFPHEGLAMSNVIRKRVPTYRLGDVRPDGFTTCLNVNHFEGDLPSGGASLFAKDCANSSARYSINSASSPGEPSTAKTTA